MRAFRHIKQVLSSESVYSQMLASISHHSGQESFSGSKKLTRFQWG
jgi:hypothetical protein